LSYDSWSSTSAGRLGLNVGVLSCGAPGSMRFNALSIASNQNEAVCGGVRHHARPCGQSLFVATRPLGFSLTKVSRSVQAARPQDGGLAGAAVRTADLLRVLACRPEAVRWRTLFGATSMAVPVAEVFPIAHGSRTAADPALRAHTGEMARVTIAQGG
jgi:hypothetical protein